MLESGGRIAARDLDEAEHAPVADGGQAIADPFGDPQAAPGQAERQLILALHRGDERARVQRRAEALIGLLALVAQREASAACARAAASLPARHSSSAR